MKKIVAKGIVFVLFQAFPLFLLAQDSSKNDTAGAAVVAGLYNAILKFDNKPIKKIQGFTGSKAHTWWACTYKDGYVVYNDFRSHRTALDVYNYFVSGYGDCDAFTQPSNKHICYETPLQAKKHSDEHGPIVDIQFKDSMGKYQSVINERKEQKDAIGSKKSSSP